MKFFDLFFGAERKKRVPVGQAVGGAAARFDSRVDMLLHPREDIAGAAVVHRNTFERVGLHALENIGISPKDVSLEILRIQTSDATQKYQVVVVANMRSLLSAESMIRFSSEFALLLQRELMTTQLALLGTSWSISKKLVAETAASGWRSTVAVRPRVSEFLDTSRGNSPGFVDTTIDAPTDFSSTRSSVTSIDDFGPMSTLIWPQDPSSDRISNRLVAS